MRLITPGAKRERITSRRLTFSHCRLFSKRCDGYCFINASHSSSDTNKRVNYNIRSFESAGRAAHGSDDGNNSDVKPSHARRRHKRV